MLPLDQLVDGKYKTNKNAIRKRKLMFLDLYNYLKDKHETQRKIDITDNVFNNWLKTDPNFKKLYDEINE